MSKHFLFILSAVCLLQSSCDIINPEEQIPTYIHIDSFKFVNPNPSITGTGIQKITAAWVYLDGKNVGVFELPADIPVLTTGSQQIQIAPGVDNQGYSDYKVQYPFFSFYNHQIEAQPGKTITLIPETQYIDDLKFWDEDFESGNQFVTLSGDTIRRITHADSVLEGGGSGRILLSSGANTSSEFSAVFNIKPGTRCYLEMSYKGDISFTAGAMAALSSGALEPYFLGGVNPKSDRWGKLYLDLQPFTTKLPNAVGWSVIVRAGLKEGQSDGYLLLDNIKVISY